MAQVGIVLGAATLAAGVASQSGREATTLAAARVADLTRQLEQARAANASINLQSNAVATGLGKQIDTLKAEAEGLKERVRTRERDFKEYVEHLIRLGGSHALVDIEKAEDVVVWKIVDTRSARHFCTLLLPVGRDISLFFPSGSYRAYYATGDLSDDVRRLIPEAASRGVVGLGNLEGGSRWKIERAPSELAEERLSWQEWGTEGSE